MIIKMMTKKSQMPRAGFEFGDSERKRAASGHIFAIEEDPHPHPRRERGLCP